MQNPDLILPTGTQVVTRVAARPLAGGQPLPRGAMGVVDGWRLRLHVEFDAAYAASPLPERPDYGAANAFLVRARRSMAG